MGPDPVLLKFMFGIFPFCQSRHPPATFPPLSLPLFFFFFLWRGEGLVKNETGPLNRISVQNSVSSRRPSGARQVCRARSPGVTEAAPSLLSGVVWAV